MYLIPLTSQSPNISFYPFRDPQRILKNQNKERKQSKTVTQNKPLCFSIISLCKHFFICPGDIGSGVSHNIPFYSMRFTSKCSLQWLAASGFWHTVIIWSSLKLLWDILQLPQVMESLWHGYSSLHELQQVLHGRVGHLHGWLWVWMVAELVTPGCWATCVR